jgi:hypothetical protein
VTFANSTVGLAVGWGGTVFWTTDGGISWIDRSTGTQVALEAAAFVDTSTVLAVGDLGMVLRTTNAGLSWTQLSTGTESGLKDIVLTGGGNGTAVGDYGTIFRTTNGGLNWSLQETGTPWGLRGTFFTDAFMGYAVGEFGMILATATAGNPTGIPDEGSASPLPTHHTLEQNFPNPFNPTTTIRYTLQSRTSVTLKVYDILGREVATLVDEVQGAGDKTVRFNAANLAGGVYLYRLVAGEYAETRKSVLVR